MKADKKYVDCFRKNGLVRETESQEEIKQRQDKDRRQLERRSMLERRSDTDSEK